MTELMKRGKGNEDLPLVTEIKVEPTKGGIRLEITVKEFSTADPEREIPQTWKAYVDVKNMTLARRLGAELFAKATKSETLAAKYEANQRQLAQRKKGYEE
jgi:hypothetical protein